MKNKVLKLFIFISLLFLTITFSKIQTKAYNDLDYIHLYQITIDPRDDGTLDMHFKIRWEVLDSKTDGPLTWVKIGIPNYHVDSLNAISSNIKKIKYYSDEGSFIRLNLDRKYYQGEILDLEFTSHQSYMYFLRDDKVYYDYNPGWFDEILVEKAIVRWNASDVVYANTKKVDDYYVFESKLNYGESIKLNITYDQSTFKTLDPNMQFTNEYTTPQQILLIVCIMAAILIFVIVMIIISYKNHDPYMSSRGFYGHSYVHYHHWWYPRRKSGYDKHGVRFVNPNTSNHSGHGGGCACACACACAGGGRAGCSLKDFYNTNLQSDKIIKNLKG